MQLWGNNFAEELEIKTDIKFYFIFQTFYPQICTAIC